MASALTPTERARATLLEHLSPRQRAEFERDGTFTVHGARGDKYCVGRSYNHVGRTRGWFFKKVWGHGIWLTRAADCPKFDHFLAHKLLLEADESRFQLIACCARYG